MGQFPLAWVRGVLEFASSTLIRRLSYIILPMARLLEDLVDIEAEGEEEGLTPEGREVLEEALEEIRRRRLLTYVV